VSEAIGQAMLGLGSDETRREAVAFAFFAKDNEVAEDWMIGWYPEAGLAEQKTIGASPYEAWGSAGSAPVLVLQPAEDAAAASGGRLLKQAFPDRVELVSVKGAGHALLPERPDFIALEVRDFLSRH
jgi:pimeloyl-ACP methyl ester carboxylesterase